MKKNIVLILGAGSSKDFGFPLGDEIFAEAHNLLLNTKSPDIKSKLKISFTEVERIMAQIFSNLPSDKTKYPLFEEVLTFIWHSKKYEYQDWENHGNIVSLFDKLTKEVFDTFVEMLTLTFSGIIYSNDFKKELELYETFIKSLKFKENNISFISLNYDLLIDTILLNCVKEGLIEGLNYGIGVQRLADETDRKKEGVFLLKPHGSLNLSFCTAYSHGRELFYYSERDITIDVMNKSDRIKCPIDRCGHYVKPLIIPPLYMKESYIKEVIKRQVYVSKRGPRTLDSGVIEFYRLFIDREISGVLLNADEIIIIGYSMPPYDFDFKSLLIKGLMPNKNRKNVPIHIITKAKGKQLDNIIKRFENLAGKVNVISSKGFYNFLRNSSDSLLRLLEN